MICSPNLEYEILMDKVIFVSDIFAESYAGGAELTTEALIASSPYEVKKIQSAELTLEKIKKHPNCFWIFGNFSGLSQDAKAYFLKNEKYSVLEYDYKFCRYRNPSLHEFDSGKCDCESNFEAKLNSLFILKASSAWWMSQGQKEIHEEKFPFLKEANSTILSSIFSDETISKLESLDTSNKNSKWILLNSPSAVKGADASIRYAKSKNLDYELVWGLDYDEMLTKLATSKGLLFLPAGEDTCPRIVIEAKLLDCELLMNDKVQHQKEEWFKTKESTLAYIKSRPEVFWKEIKKNVQDSF
jgi:hypothetical protein